MTDAEDRFWSKVRIGDGCWTWTASLRHKGYGQFRFDGKTRKAHRVSWEIANGPIPEGQHVLHRCDNPACVRPSHLFLGTNEDNHADMMAKGRNGYAAHRGETNGFARLDEESVRRIRRLLADGQTQKELGRLFGVSNQTIFRIQHGHSWSHVQ